MLLDSTTAGAVNAADVQTLVSAAAGIDATRGDTVAVSAMAVRHERRDRRQDSLAAAAAADKTRRADVADQDRGDGPGRTLPDLPGLAGEPAGRRSASR